MPHFALTQYYAQRKEKGFAVERQSRVWENRERIWEIP